MKEKRWVIIVTFIFFLSVLAIGNQDPGNPTFELFKVSPSVVMAKHDYGSNITCVSTDNGLFFVDSGMKTELAKKFRLEMEKRFSKSTRALLMTHAHSDHYLGMGAFSDVPVLAAANGKDSWDKQLAIRYNEKQIAAYNSVFPKFGDSLRTARPFKPTEWLTGTGGSVRGNRDLVFMLAGGHSADCVAFYFKRENILISGDLFQVDQYPFFGDSTADVFQWIKTLKKWEKLPIVKICAGHGPAADKTYVTDMRIYYESLIKALKKLKKENLTHQQVIDHESLPKPFWPNPQPRPGWYNYCIVSLYDKL